jgi:hypothetical protein
MDKKLFQISVIGLFILILVIFATLILLQPSPQEKALGNLDAAGKLLDKVDISDASRLENASKELRKVKLSAAAQKQLDAALAAIDDAEISLAGDRARLNGGSSEIKYQIEQAKANLTAPSFVERLARVKDQILALLWPVLIVILLWSLLHSKASINFFKQLATIVSNVKIPGGLEIDFATAIKTTQEEVLKEYRGKVVSKYDGLATQYQIAETLSRIVDGPVKAFFKTSLGKEPDFRCTVHVRDILFDNSIYQLIDYVGREKGGRGRAWSVRRGMIGRTWRLEENYRKGIVPKEANDLIEAWGLTREETKVIAKNQTMLCYLIKGQNKSPLAMLYLDAEAENAFGTDAEMDQLLTVIGTEVTRFGLDKALEQVWQQAQASAPLIEIYADRK